MKPANFKEANILMKAPEGLEESQVQTIPAYIGEIKSGSCDGLKTVVVAWLPDAEDLRLINEGKPIFLSVVGGLPPHFLSTTFEQATTPA